MLDSKQLLTLASIVENRGFGAAAVALGVTLAAVSQRIKSLEEAVGQRLLVRGKTVRPTPAGQALLAHIQQLRLMQSDVLAQWQQTPDNAPWQTLAVAVNADSIDTWFLPGVAPLLLKHKLLLHLTIDDQDHTHAALLQGEVLGCVTTQEQALRACVSEPLGVMRYRCMAAPRLASQLLDAQGLLSPHRLLQVPALHFGTKDAMQDLFLQQHLDLNLPQYPSHRLPASDAYTAALKAGLGWGMVADQQHQRLEKEQAELVDLFPGRSCDIMLYWQHWQRESPTAQRLTQAVHEAAKAGGLS